MAAVIALVFTALSINETNAQLQITEQGQITDRYNAAITNLGSRSEDVRLGGIYALQRIMQDSPRDQPTIIVVLCAYVRDHAMLKAQISPTEITHPLTADIQAALTVIGDRNSDFDSTKTIVDLRNTDLVDADLSNSDLADADLDGADLDGADLSNHTDLTAATLRNAHLTGANLIGTNLTSANLAGADLRRTVGDPNLSYADLDKADLSSANLFNANLRSANLNNSNLRDTNLSYTDLREATFKDAILNGANLDHAKR